MQQVSLSTPISQNLDSLMKANQSNETTYTTGTFKGTRLIHGHSIVPDPCYNYMVKPQGSHIQKRALLKILVVSFEAKKTKYCYGRKESIQRTCHKQLHHFIKRLIASISLIRTIIFDEYGNFIFQ